jgi:hypothetical protein
MTRLKQIKNEKLLINSRLITLSQIYAKDMKTNWTKCITLDQSLIVSTNIKPEKQ